MANKEDIFATATLPRVLVVSRRSVRKNKFVDFVGEYHLDLLVTNGAVPVIVPRVAGIHNHLDSFDPFHGVLLCEGEDIDPSLHSTTTAKSSHFSQSDIDEVRRLHHSDTNIDHNKDEIELSLANLCFRRNIPILGICRGSQLLNVASGGTLFLDLQKQLPRGNGNDVVHIDYGNYDGHRHGVRLVEGTPLGSWFKESSVDGKIMVNSYHHQGVEKLAGRFVPMAFAMDGLVEGFYDPNCYVPEKGRFVVGLQFHPERMRRSPESEEFDYPGCKSVYQEFVKAVVACQKMTRTTGSVPKSVMEVHQEVEKKAYIARVGAPTLEGPEIEAGDESNGWIKFGEEEETEAEGGCNCLMSEEREMLARTMMGKVPMGQLSELLF